jgi:hypothetical protein
MLTVTVRADSPEELRRELEEIAGPFGRVELVDGETIGSVVFEGAESCRQR